MQFSPASWRSVELHSPFDRRSGPVYVLIGIVTVIGLCLCWVLGFSISPGIFPQYFGVPMFAVLAGWGLRRIGRPNFGGAMEVLGLSFIQGLAAFFLIAPLASVSLALADGPLAHADHLIGFDWIAYARVVNGPFFNWVYHSFSWQPALVSAVVFRFERQDRGWQFALAAVIAVFICGLIFPLAPALGADLHYGIKIPGAVKSFAPALLSLQEGHRVLDNSVFTGLISFPSYHAAAAILFVWACWTTPFRWPVLLLNILMVASTMPIGAHYLVDVVAGVAVGAISIPAAIELSRRFAGTGARMSMTPTVLE